MTSSKSNLANYGSSRLYLIVFGFAVAVAAIATFLAISNIDPARPMPIFIFLVFGVNGALIVILGWLLIRRYRQLQSRRHITGEGRLVRRFLLLFSASSVIPATLAAIFLGATVTQGLDNWFETRIGTVIEETAVLAQERVDTLSALIGAQSREVAARIDFEDTAGGIENDPLRYASYLGRQATALGAQAAFVISAEGELIILADVPRPIPFNPPTAIALQEAREGLVGQTLYQESGVVTATVRLNYPPDTFVHLVHQLDPVVFERLASAAQAVSQYRQAAEVSGQLQRFMAIGYAQVVILALLLFARIGLDAGSQIAQPLGTLATAAGKVRDGDLTARVAVPGNDDEIDTLTVSFNTMAAQLGTQRSALMSARSVSEDRRQFLETLLSQISAGVIRIDQSMTVTLANASAESLIGLKELQGQRLGDVLPEFKTHAHRAMRDQTAGDTSLEISIDGETKHIRLRTLADGDGGCVLTFDDATKIITAQRHMAWRDVARRIAHEIRNPLTPIHLAAERLHRRYSKTLSQEDEVFERSLETITRQATDIGRMVDEFSKFARMPKPDIRPFDFVAVLSDTVFSQRMVTPDIKYELASDLDELIYYGDERLLGQAFGNLVKNASEAISAMPEEMEVIGQIKLAVIQGDNFLRITIDDNGPGFPEEDRERLLEPYVTTRERGTGLGLAIVNRVIVDHGGSITLAKRPDGKRGARVSISLPCMHDEKNVPQSRQESVEEVTHDQ